MAQISSEIFREYDIRGLVDTQLESATCEAIGRGLGTMLLRGCSMGL